MEVSATQSDFTIDSVDADVSNDIALNAGLTDTDGNETLNSITVTNSDEDKATTLALNDAATLDFDHLANSSDLNRIDRIDLSGGGQQEITNLHANHVLNMTGEDNTLTILGNEGDSVSLGDGNWTQGDTITQDGQEFNQYVGQIDLDGQLQDIQILIDTNVQVDQ